MSRRIDTQTEVDFVLLCDHAEVVNGKLYMLGGAWNRVTRVVPLPLPGFGESLPPLPAKFSVVTSVLIDWNETNEQLPLEFTVEDADGRSRLWEAQAQISAGRSADAIKGAPVRTVFALPIMLPFPAAGEFAARVRLMDRPADHMSDRTERFEVVDQTVLAGPPTGQARLP